MDFRIISIGTLSTHELWDQQGEPRTAHATTTLITSEDRRILVDPGLPAKVISARLNERAGLRADQITDVFLTCFRPEHRRGLEDFTNARWLIAEQEREQVGAMLVQRFQAEQDQQTQQQVREEVALLQRFEAAPDHLAEDVALFPMPGMTPGTAGLVLSHQHSTTLIAGPAVASVEHLEQGRVGEGAYDEQQAKQALSEVIEIADAVVPGYDNIVLNPIREAWQSHV